MHLNPLSSRRDAGVRPLPRKIIRKPLALAVASALLGLGSEQALAVPLCNTSPVTIVCTTAVLINTNTTYEVNSGGAIDVVAGTSVSTSGESTITINNSGRISGITGIAATSAGDVVTINNNNAGVLAGSTNATTQAAGAFFDIYNNSGANIVGSIGARNISNSGTITLKTGVALNDISNSGAGAGTATLTGGFTQTSTGTLRVAIISTSGAGTFSTLTANSATLAGTINVDVKAGSGLSLSSGVQNFKVIHTLGGGITNQFSQVTDNSALFNFTQRIVNGEDVYLDAVRATTVAQATQANGNLPGFGAAQVLDSQPAGMQSVLDALGRLGTTAEVSNAVSQTLPLLTGNSVAVSSGALSGINRVVQARIEGNNGLSSGEAFAGDKNVWMKPFGSAANQDDSGGVSGYKARMLGLAGGIDGVLSNTTRLGMALAYANATIDSNASAAPQTAKVDVFQLIGYGSTNLDAATELSYQADIGNNNNKGQRTLSSFGVVADSSYRSQTLHAGVGLGRIYPMNEATSFSPTVRLDYTQVKDDAYTETGAGALNLIVDGRTNDQLIYALDGKVSHKLSSATTLNVNLGVAYDAKARQSSITAAYAGAPGLAFTTQGMDVNPTTYRLGLGVVNKDTKGLEMTGRYDVEARAGYANQTLSAKLRWVF